MAKISGTLDLNCTFSEEYKFTTYTVVFSLVFIFGLVGNAGALYVFFKLSVKNRLSTIFLIHLSASDLVFILTLPARVAFYLSQSGKAELSPTSSATLLSLACRFSAFFFYIGMYCSIMFLTALSVCRYLVLAGYVRLQNRQACRRAHIACAVIWAVILGGNILYIAVTSGFSMQTAGCLEPRGKSSWGLLYRLNLLVLVSCFVLPLAVVLVCYSLMIRHVLRAHEGQRRRDVALICLVLLIFCVCFLPYHVQRTLHLHYVVHERPTCQLLDRLQKTVVVTLCFAAFNSCLDPLIFLYVGHGFIPALKRLIAQKENVDRLLLDPEDGRGQI
uniref:G-protein coupled receptors family 1 profile domain-containing protein n=1 Tax=Electrophorus electricus TaxID=8005 RepID=A0A4W4HS88_ELEEL